MRREGACEEQEERAKSKRGAGEACSEQEEKDKSKRRAEGEQGQRVKNW